MENGLGSNAFCPLEMTKLRWKLNSRPLLCYKREETCIYLHDGGSITDLRMLRITRLLQRASVKSLKAENRTVLLRGFVCETKHSEESGYFYAKCSNLSPQNKGLCSSTAPLLCCWNCNYSYYANIHGTTHFFCPSCNVVQQPWDGRTYFDILNW